MGILDWLMGKSKEEKAATIVGAPGPAVINVPTAVVTEQLLATKNAFDEATKALHEVSKAIESGRDPDLKKGVKVEEKLKEGVRKGATEGAKQIPKTGFWQWVKSWFF